MHGLRRPVRPFTQSVHWFLSRLHAHGFVDAPTPLGFDDLDREVLTYVAGDVPREPLPDYAATTEALVTLARLIRRQHDAADGWEVPADAIWGCIPGAVPDGVQPRFGFPELVAHMDY